ncbi:MAG: D-alanyl-D-alanine carboxypeptidase [bacterium]|nr:D-alanyl-D-alanine carboxypeptidase [bacterium]
MTHSINSNFRLNSLPRAAAGLLLLVMLIVYEGSLNRLVAADWGKIKSLIGPGDSLLVADPAGQIVIAKNEHKKRVPASILKIFTSLGALHYLGSDYRFTTEFYLGPDSNLKIKGYGDPLLISEIVNAVSRVMAALIGSTTVINDIVVDDSYFSQPLTIPGITSSTQPYDAPNGALCVNFNTVYFKRTPTGYASAEAQTPLLPFAAEKIKLLKPKSGRIVLSHVEKENTIYAGKLFQYYLDRHGVRFRGAVKTGRVDKSVDKLIYRYVSRFSLPEIIAKLLEHSNNFTTNQLLISSGIKMFGSPGNLNNGVAALVKYAADGLQLKDMTIVEGSGISRKNRVSADQMLRILDRFESHHTLLRRRGREYYKTGTLYGISTRAGYIESGGGGFYRYVVMMNSRGKSTRPVMQRLLQELD